MNNGESTTAPQPEQVLMQMMVGKNVAQALSVAADLQVADALTDGALDVETLADRINADVDGLYRLLRALSAVGVFVELPKRRFENNPMSDKLREDAENSLRAMVRWLGEEVGWRAWTNLGFSVRTGQPAFEQMYGTNYFNYGIQNPETGHLFNDAMTSYTSATTAAVVDAYDFSGISRLVDVGGGCGEFMLMLAARYTFSQGIVFDLPAVIEQTQQVVQASTYADRIQAEAGNFFDAVPKGADVYIMKHIMHDWGDERCRQILQRCRAAMADGGRLLVMDQVICDGPSAAFSKLVDLEMMVLTPGGRERTEAEFAELFQTAGFKLSKLVPTAGPISILEAHVE